MNDTFLLSAIIFLPTVGALLLGSSIHASEAAMRGFANFITFATFMLTLFAWFRFDPSNSGHADDDDGRALDRIVEHQLPAGRRRHQPAAGGAHGLISWLAMLASGSVTKQVRGYLILFLLLETGMLGVFIALDFFLFYVFWEVMLLPMYFLIGIWGGPRREYAAIKFFLYTLVGGVLMLIALLMFYFDSAGSSFAAMPEARRSTSCNWRRSGRGKTPRACNSRRSCRSRRSSCSSSGLPSRCPSFRSTPGSPMRTSKRRLPSA